MLFFIHFLQFPTWLVIWVVSELLESNLPRKQCKKCEKFVLSIKNCWSFDFCVYFCWEYKNTNTFFTVVRRLLLLLLFRPDLQLLFVTVVEQVISPSLHANSKKNEMNECVQYWQCLRIGRKSMNNFKNKGWVSVLLFVFFLFLKKVCFDAGEHVFSIENTSYHKNILPKWCIQQNFSTLLFWCFRVINIIYATPKNFTIFTRNWLWICV